MLRSIGFEELLVAFALMVLIVIWPFWRIFSKAGFPGIMAVLMIAPFLNIIMLYYLAFGQWPALNAARANTTSRLV